MARNQARPYRLGIDIGSTTAKIVIIDPNDTIVLSRYQRHHADIHATVRELLEEAQKEFGGQPLAPAITGSGGLSLAQHLDVEFVQEVIASKAAVEHSLPTTDVAIELGGEDAKIIFFDGTIEQRMNGTCAGGTGAFIDQMASLLNTNAAGLDELAARYTTLYPIASRCGVFAKSDVQPLLNDGARREDIAASIFQAVVNQTISGLACGHPIHGNVAFLGGPLQYLPQLNARFKETLNLDEAHCLEPRNGHLFVAFGAALNAPDDALVTIEDLIGKLDCTTLLHSEASSSLEALFDSDEQLEEFRARHAAEDIEYADLASCRGAAYLGIDAGSTTFKLALIDENNRLLYQDYARNRGDVIGCAKDKLATMYAHLPVDENGQARIHIAHATVTGYGEELLQSALKVDSGEIETIAHLRAAQQLDDQVDFILDIGGQDMKCLRVRDGVIDHIMLNEACSSGCGSFLETFAESMGYSIEDFAAEALKSKRPVDLGSRCTVFMNSRVKQAQKEGASIADISAGLSYSVIKNALFKVIKVRDPKALGKHLVVQGGTFKNDAVLRAFELLSRHECKRPAQAGIMGAYGAALIAHERAQDTPKARTSMLGAEELAAFSAKQTTARCKGCENSCLLTISKFDRGGSVESFVSGNRCERGAGSSKDKAEDALEFPNLFAYKEKLLFERECLSRTEAKRATVGLPRALNMYENYPFWHAFFTRLGFAVELSDPSSKTLYESGMGSMPSESVCFPAKLAHGHVMNLLDKNVDFIWMPCVRMERKEDDDAQNCFNCPIVSSYPESLRLNIDALHEHGIAFYDPYLPYNSKKRLKQRLLEEMQAMYKEHKSWKGCIPSKREISDAVDFAWQEDEKYKQGMHDAGTAALEWIDQNDATGIVLIGRPYHIDPLVNHGIPNMLNKLGFAVLTEDSVAWMGSLERDLRVIDQWMYHTRLYNAAKFVTTRSDLELVQLNSFGCGIDAVTCDEVMEILESAGKIYTTLKIDEVSNLGAARIRMRSLAAALEKRGKVEPAPCSTAFPKVPFTKEMKEEGYTIIAPQMAPIHFELLEAAFRGAGYNLVALPAKDPKAVDAGLRYVNNDICYPSILTTGQIMAAVESGDYDLDRLAVLIVQTGGGCRATNYIALIRKALKEYGRPDIPVISMSFKNIGEHNSGWNYSLPLLLHMVWAVVLGDVLMQCLYRTRPYEKVKGSANALYEAWMTKLKADLVDLNFKQYAQACTDIVSDFDELFIDDTVRKPRVGVVGEILVKYHPTANNDVVGTIEREGCEAVVPGFLDFFQYAALNTIHYNRYLDGKKLPALLGGKLGYAALDKIRADALDALRSSKHFECYGSVEESAKKASDVLQLCNCMGEGWLLTAEMIELIENGSPNIIICSPFACLPNHVVGKSVTKELKARYPLSNIVPIDYDPGASVVNQLNRIKLTTTIAKENLARQNEEGGNVESAQTDDAQGICETNGFTEITQTEVAQWDYTEDAERRSQRSRTR